MNDPFIRTVLGDIAPEAFGVCDAHEHLIIDDPYVHETWPDRKLDNVIKAVGELTTFKELGGSALVDTMPMACGRNIEKLVQIARETNVHVVAATGLHLEKYYRPNHWLDGFDAGDLVEFFVADIERGIPADESQPPATRTDHRAGIIKVAGQQHLTHRQRTAFFAAAEAHRRTGCPIVTHTDGGHNAIDQVDLLLNHGVQPNKITLSHVDRIAAPEQHRQLLNFGVNLTYDAAFRWPPEHEPNPSVHLIATLLPEFPTQIMVGMDAASTRYWRSYGGSPGLEWLVTRLRRLLEQSEVDDVLLHRLYIDNPANAFAFG